MKVVGSKPLPCLPDAFSDWLYTVVVGFLVVSYWRGTWTLLDIWTCGQPPTASLTGGDSFCLLLPAIEDYPDGENSSLRFRSASLTYGIGMGLLIFGGALMWGGVWTPNEPGEITRPLAAMRIVVVYILGASAVCIWRGVWYWADYWILPYDAVASFWTTSLVGSTACFAMLSGASILAPPALFLMDGPGNDPPPLATTIMSSWQALALPAGKEPPSSPWYVKLLDIVGSFVVLPWMVVWFWRGTWLIQDLYFWGLTAESSDLHNSLGWSTLLFVLSFALTCEPTMGLLEGKVTNPTLIGIIGRLRTWVLAWGTVAFWRVVWFVWDEFLGGPTSLSAGLGHALSVVALTVMGCLSSINAPASTLGVDAVPHPECADEPLFSMLPVPFEVLHFMGIARRPTEQKGAGDIEMTTPKGKQVDYEQEKPQEQTFDDEDGSSKIEEKAPPQRPSLDSQGSIRLSNFHADAEGRRASYYEMQRPHASTRTMSQYAMRPGMENERRRSSYFRNR